jgi:hypothetical protein
MMTENSSMRTDRANAGRSRSGFLGAIFGIGKKKGCEKERIRPTDPKRPSTSILEKNTRRADGASKKSRASTPDDSLYSFMMAKHGRLGAYSAASQLPDEMFASIVDFALDPALAVKKVFRNAPALVNLVVNNSHRTLLQRHASDAFTESIYGKPAKEVCVYKKYIAARNAALRAQPTQNPPLGYSTGLQKRRRILKAGGIKAATDMLTQALAANPPRVSSIRSAVFALTTLTTDVERDGLVQSHVKMAGTVNVYIKAIEYAVQCSDNFTFLYIAHSLGSLTYDDMRGIPEAIEVRSEIVAAGVVIPLINKLQRTKDSDMRYLGALLLANLACDIDHNEALMAAGVVPVLLKCILASPKDQRVQSNCITVLFNLSVRRPDCVKEMKKSGAQQVLQQAYDCHGVNENCQILITSLMQQLEDWNGYVGTAEEEAEQDALQEKVKEENRQQELDDERMSMGLSMGERPVELEEMDIDIDTYHDAQDGGKKQMTTQGSGCSDDTDVYGDNDSDYEYDMYADNDDEEEEVGLD